MPRLGCDNRIEKSSMNIADRVFDLRNRVKWLKNVEYCLMGDQNNRLAKIKTERHNIETLNNNLRKKIINNQYGNDMTTVDDIECINYKRNKVMQEHNQLLFMQKCLLDRLGSLDDQKLKAIPIKKDSNSKNVANEIRDLQDRLSNVKLINKTLNTCKQHLQCDLDLLDKELPNLQQGIEEKVQQKTVLKKEFKQIVAENKRHLKAYQELLNRTEAQSRQRRTIYEQAMTSVSQQLEDQYPIQMLTVNEMTTPYESRKLNGATNSITNIPQRNLIMMNSDEILQVRCMYDEYYNIITSGFPINIDHTESSKCISNEMFAKTSAMLTMINRMVEEKEQIQEQINRTDKIFKLIEMSMNLKNETRQKIVDTMTEQHHSLELFVINDTVEEQNRIIRQINDFIMVLSKILCEYMDEQSLIEPPIDFIGRLQYISELVLKTVKTMNTEANEEDNRQISPNPRRSVGEETSQILKESRSIDQSIASSLSSVSSRIKRYQITKTIY